MKWEERREKKEMRDYPKNGLSLSPTEHTQPHNTNNCKHHVFVDTVKLTQEHSVWPGW